MFSNPIGKRLPNDAFFKRGFSATGRFDYKRKTGRGPKMIQFAKRIGVERCLAVGNVLVAVVIALGVFRLLPVRSRWVSVPTIIVLALLVASAIVLARRTRAARKLARVTGLALLWGGLVGAGTLTLGLTFSRAVVASTAGPGPLALAFAILLVLPYTVVYAMGLLAWAGGAEAPARSATAEPPQ